MGNKIGNTYFKDTPYSDITKESKNQTIAIDGYMLLYKYCAVYRTKTGELFRGYEDMVTSHIYGLLPLFINLKIHFKQIIYVFEGPAPMIKKPQQTARLVKKQLAKKKYEESIRNTESYKIIANYKKQAFSIDKHIIESTIKLLDLLGIKYMFAEGEGEKTCEKLAVQGYADVVWSNDWDALCLNHEVTYRNLYFKNKKVYAQVLKKSEVLKKLNLDAFNFLMLVLTAGCDYTSGIPKVGPIIAYKLISTGSLQNIYPLQYAEIKEIAQKLEKISDEYVQLVQNSLDVEKLESFLLKECEFSSAYIQKNIQLLKYRVREFNKLNLILPSAPYANGILHAGRMGGSILPADIFNRFIKSKGYNSYFLITIDAHGTPITESAKLEGKEYSDFVNYWSQKIKNALNVWQIEYNALQSTTNPSHKEYVNNEIKRLIKLKLVKPIIENIFNCNKCKKNITDRLIRGTCVCGAAIKNIECESCGIILEPIEIKDPLCGICNTKLDIVSSPNYEINLTKHKDEILDHYSTTLKDYDIRGFYKKRKRVNKSILRPLEWGVATDLLAGHVIYVWIEALYSYLSFTQLYRTLNTRVYHWIGVDNLHFHTAILGHIYKYKNYELPERIFVRRWFLLDTKKQSSSQKNYIDIEEYNRPLISDFFRAYISKNDSLHHESNLSIFDYNDFIISFFNNVHNLFYRITAYYPSEYVWTPKNIIFIDLDNALINSEHSVAWNIISKKASHLNSIFQTQRNSLEGLKQDKFLNEVYGLIKYITYFMPTYGKNWQNSFLKHNYKITISDCIL